MQRLTTVARQLPHEATLTKFCTHSAQLETSLLGCRRHVKTHIKDLAKIQKEMYAVSGTTVKQQKVNDEVGSKELFDTLDKNFQ